MQQKFLGEVDRFIFSGVKFLQNVVYQKFFKSVNFSVVIQKK